MLPSADICLPDAEISRFHAILTLSGGRWQIEDLRSGNGVLVNGKRITEPCRIKKDDEIRIGRRTLTVIRGAERSRAE